MTVLLIFTASKKITLRMPQRNDENTKREAGRKKDHLIFFICLLLAASFWMLIKMSDVYSVSYRMKIKYTHLPKGRLITALKDSSATVHFKSNGYNLLYLILHRQLDSLKIDLRECEIKRGPDNAYFINTANIRESTAQKLGVNDRDLEFSKSRLYFTLERLHRTRLKVFAVLDLGFKSQFRLYGYKIEPKEVTVYGPKKILDTLKTLRTVTVHRENLEQNQTVMADIKNPFPGMLKLFPSKVKILLNVEKYTEGTIQVPVDVSGIKPTIRTFPATVTINFNVFIRDYEKVHPGQFKVVPDIKNIDLRTVKKLRLQMISQPKDISNARIVPPEVEFIIVN